MLNQERSALPRPQLGQRSSRARPRRRTARRPRPTADYSVENGLGWIGRVVVEAPPGLAPEIAALHALLELGGRVVVGILRHLEGFEPGVVTDIETGEVAQLEGPQGMIQSQLHGLVDIGVVGHALLEAVIGLADESAENAVDEEPGELLAQDDGLAPAAPGDL